ncbi:hypothetical protein J8I26_02090 [Herbaspirillum sp. LeCh32-8]|uniref:hypothetical protein n=1 Tax=Herbaspirillum sp. LeCh32-8 TaxID=2821356 RepID=UPI001AE5335C|nr:hypothetical protein [Herbaspirillum sp. LeCh32-8]MBP0596875.1 hypothetical protein [Herbaspirillum sp. LeCh32-8]
MRRLLLLLLTFLLPLQLLAATVVDLPSPVAQAHAAASADGEACRSPEVATINRIVVDPAPLHASTFVTDGAVASSAALSESGAGQDGEEDDGAAPSAQAELEDHTIPARIATPDIPWQPFPHLFSAPLSWASFVRDQQRPPPLV